MAQKGLFVYAELDYRIHFEAFMEWYHMFSAYVRSSFVRIICFGVKQIFLCADNLPEGGQAQADTERRH
jgi:hypothetical protein